MPSTWSRRTVLAATAASVPTALAGCGSLPLVSGDTPLTVRVANDSVREYRLEVTLLKPDGDQLADARVLDESYVVGPTDGFETLTDVENRRYHVRARLSGMGYFSEQYTYQYYPSCGTSDELSPTLSIVIHTEPERDQPFIGFGQAECGAG